VSGGRAFANVLQKCLEVVPPGGIHLDAAATTVGVLLAGWPVAAGLDLRPAAVLGSSVPAVFGQLVPAVLHSGAATAADPAIAQQAAGYNPLATALASALPLGFTAPVGSDSFDDAEPAKLLAGEIDQTGFFGVHGFRFKR